MPAPLLLNKQNSKSGDLLTIARANEFDAKRPSSALAKPSFTFDIPIRRKESKTEDLVNGLKMQVSSLKKENMELRLMLNYFMQLNLTNN